MTDIKKLSFYNPNLGGVSFNGVVEHVVGYLKEAPGEFYEIVVGCDSSSEKEPVFPVVLVVLRAGKGGRFFISKIRFNQSKEKKFHNFHQRILQEVLISCDVALNFRESIEKSVKKLSFPVNYRFQYIHADVGAEGRTKDMIKEVSGLIESNGFKAKIKPESFAASIVADRFT
ncbi:hypothetical protein J7J23_01485 [bacterium]|nr:hypothetical protein [bacterium]